jgi:hypothetical protein
VLRSTKLVSNRQSVKALHGLAQASQRSAMVMGQLHSRMFASFAGVEKGIQKLTKALEKEIKYENENYTQLEDIETFLNDSGFKFEELDQGISMKLTKTVGNKLIEVHFDSR